MFNVCGVIITTNYKTNGIYLPAEDRRHYVAWSNLNERRFSPTPIGTKSVEMVRGRRLWSCRRLSRHASISPTSIRRQRHPRRKPSGPLSMPTGRPRIASLPTPSTGWGGDNRTDGEPEIVRPKVDHHRQDRARRERRLCRLDQRPKEPPRHSTPAGGMRIHARAQSERQGWPLEDQWPSASRLCTKRPDAQETSSIEASALAGTGIARPANRRQ